MWHGFFSYPALLLPPPLTDGPALLEAPGLFVYRWLCSGMWPGDSPPALTPQDLIRALISSELTSVTTMLTTHKIILLDFSSLSSV